MGHDGESCPSLKSSRLLVEQDVIALPAKTRKKLAQRPS
jgi:hypothetical protein